MKALPLNTIKKELQFLSKQELIELCLKLSRFKKENKELLTYLLVEAQDEEQYISSIKELQNQLFSEINTNSYFYIRKSVRKILSLTKKFIRYSKKKETEVELLLHFCWKLRELTPSISGSPRLINVYHKQLDMANRAIGKLHPDLQYDYRIELENFPRYNI